jgi:hypothetical protein
LFNVNRVGPPTRLPQTFCLKGAHVLRRILNLFRAHEPKKRRCVPSSPDLPELWPDAGTAPRLDVLDDADTRILTALCDDYWNSYLATNVDESFIRDSEVHRRALEIIATRSDEVLPWARQRLSHAGYDAREDAASLIARWAANDILGNDKEAIARELVTLAVTPPNEDTKEAQAAGVALRALSIIGGPQCMAAIRQVLTSRDWDNDDNQWECVKILAHLTNELFMDADDPVAAANSWLAANPTNEA